MLIKHTNTANDVKRSAKTCTDSLMDIIKKLTEEVEEWIQKSDKIAKSNSEYIDSNEIHFISKLNGVNEEIFKQLDLISRQLSSHKTYSSVVSTTGHKTIVRELRHHQ